MKLKTVAKAEQDTICNTMLQQEFGYEWWNSQFGQVLKPPLDGANIHLNTHRRFPLVLESRRCEVRQHLGNPHLSDCLQEERQ